MKITKCIEEVKSSEWLTVCVDVGQRHLDIYSKYEEDGSIYELRDHFSNRVSSIKNQLKEYESLSVRLGLKGVRVICEPTGGYERKLLRIARSHGHRTSYVSGEGVSKSKVIHSNDTGKTDQKDPEVIYTLIGLDRSLTARSLPPDYDQLRELHQYYEDETKQIVAIRNRVHAILKEWFCDLRYSNSFVFSNSGLALYRQFDLDPHKIVACKWKYFVRRMRKEVKGIRLETLEKIYVDAKSSVLHELAGWRRDILYDRLQELMTDWHTHTERQNCFREKMVALFNGLPEKKKFVALEGISDFQLSRLVAETGPLSDFRHSRQLIRYGGLNIRERRSGKYQGQNKISKKGRSLLRKVLYQIAFSSLVQANGLYGNYYSKKKKELANGTKAMIAVMRKFLKMIFGLMKSQSSFDASRVFLCHFEYQKKVA